MEKIVTKIGDVTIERRVSKPQQPKESSVGCNLQQQLPPTHKIISNPQEQVRSLMQHNISKQQPFTLNKIDPNQTSSNAIYRTIQGGNLDLTQADNRPVAGNETENPVNYSKTETLMSQDIGEIDTPFQQIANSDITKLEMRESEVSWPQKVEPAQNPSVPTFSNQIQEKNEPDLSKFVGISVERRKGVESHVPMSLEEGLSTPSVADPDVSIRRYSSPQEAVFEKPENDLSEEDFEDSFDEEGFGDGSVPPEDETEIDQDLKQSATTSTAISEEDDENQESEEALLEDDSIKKELHEEEPIKDEDIKEEVEETEEPKDSDINDLACTDLVELMQKGEIEGEIEDVKEEEEEEITDEGDEKKDNKRKAEGEEDEEKDEEVPAKKKKKRKENNEDSKEDEEDEEKEGEGGDEKDKNIDKSKVTNANLRKNIREVMDETKLDEATLAAQRQEAERLKRLQEQQRIIREVQRQIALNRQNQKSQNKVLSLLQGNSQTSILKTSSTTVQGLAGRAKSQNSVLVKLSNGEQTSLNNRKMMELLKNSKNKTILGKPQITKTFLKQGMVTPSVSIAPVAKKEPVVDDKKKKKGDVVTLSSDSEDDCIVLSDEDESEPEEDPANSGMHTNDKYNLPDEKGRVIVNVGHPESETDLYLAPQIARIIKPHQIGGIRFLYDNVIESIDRYESSTGFGCILAHSMGLGKTLQIVSFSDIFLRYTKGKTILCIMPINTIQNWLAEFNMWLPKESTSEDVRCRDFDLYIVNESLKNINSRAKVILDWHKNGGVLLMGYELFRLLSLKKSYKSKKKKKDPEEEDAKQKELMEEVYSALVIPGPDLVICDEGHRIKNSHATTSQALKQIRTKRRIVLTGYPLQNNLLEYWCMVDFVRPNYLGTKTEFSNMFERPIQNGQCIDSTPQDKRLMRYRAHVLHSLLEGFVQRRSHAVLQSTLPEKEEYVLLLRFTPFQRKLYDTFMNEVVRTVAVPNPLKAFAVCCKIWNHPDVLYNFLKKKGEEIDLDLEEALPPSLQIPQFPYGQQSVGQEGMTPGGTPWPRRGPGSRGGKVRQSANRRVGRGRKPAATIPPNVTTEKGMQENENFNSGQFPPNENYSGQQDGMDNFQGRNYNQNQFGFSNDYNNQSSGYTCSSYNKNPLNNLEDMSSNNFQNKRFFPQQSDSGNQNQYANQNFESNRSEANFNPNTSNDSNLNSSFESNLNSSDSNYNQNESKPFDFNQEFNSDFYPNNNFSNTGGSSNYPAENKNSGFQGNTYFQNSGFRNSENFDYQSTSNNMNTNFQGYERSNSNFQNSGSTANFQGTSNNNQRGVANSAVGQSPTFQNSGSTSNFQNPVSNMNFQGNSGQNFQGSNNNQRVAGGTVGQTSSFQNSGSNSNSNYQSNSGLNFQGANNNQRMLPGGTMGQNSNFQNSGPNTNFQNHSNQTFQGSSNSNQRVAGGTVGQTPGFQSSGSNSNSNYQSNSGPNYQGTNNPNSLMSGGGTIGQTSNFQNSGSNSNFQTSGSNSNFQNNSGSNFQGSNNNQRIGGSSLSQTQNFQNTTTTGNFQDSNSSSNFQGNFQSSESNFEGNRGNFMDPNSRSNFQGNSSNFDRSGNFQGQSRGNFQGNEQGFWPRSNWSYPETSKGSGEFRNSSTTSDFMQQKFNSFEDEQDVKVEEKGFAGGESSGAMYNKKSCDYPSFGKNESDSKFSEFEENKGSKQEEEDEKKEDAKGAELLTKKEDPSLPYEWATDLFKTYVTGVIENSSKMEVFFHIVTESIKLGDRLLVFSQSLLTLDLIEDYLHRQNVPDKEEVWTKNRNYFRLDGSTPGLEREKLINEFNGNPDVYLFLVSTRAGSLGINLVGANRVVVFDASWNPCHDTQAVCRVYRYGQRKPCFVYRLVMDSCLEKKIYDRQVNKQGMADRVVDELNPDAHLSIKEVTNLCWDDQEDTTVMDFSHLKDKYNDEIIKILLDRCSKLLSKEPFQHESLLIDRKEKKLSQAEKRLAKRSYELEKQAANQPKNIYSFFPNTGQRNFAKPIASVRPMQSEMGSRINTQIQNRSKWIPAEVWQKQGMSAQEMTLPLDVVIPTSSPEKTSIVLKAGQRVMVLKSPKGIYMQLENGKIIAIRSAFKVGQNGPGGSTKQEETKKEGSMTPATKTNLTLPTKVTQPIRPGLVKQPFMKPFAKVPDKKIPGPIATARSRQIMGKAKPFVLNQKFETVSPDIKQRLLSGKANFGSQEEKFPAEPSTTEERSSVEERVESADEVSFSDEKATEEKTEEKIQEKTEMSSSLETLRKVTESISEQKREEPEAESQHPGMNTMKNYRHGFTSQAKGNSQVTSSTPQEEEKKEVQRESGDGKATSTTGQQGNENVQNWLMNQSYPPMDPYGNYFPGYYAYGPGPGPMIPPYDGFYPPSNYGHPIGRNSPMIPTPAKQQTDSAKATPQQNQPQVGQTPPNPTPRNPSTVNTPPMYPPYPNPYPYPYNYPGNPGFNSQGFPFPNQNQVGQQPTTNPPSGNSSTAQNQQTPHYDSSMYSAFHRPDAPFQAPENPYPTPYPRPPYPSSGTPGFFPYNAPYPNYPYGPNFNPYMHPAGYGYPMQNTPPVNNQAQNSTTNTTPSNSNNNSNNSSNSSSNTNNS